MRTIIKIASELSSASVVTEAEFDDVRKELKEIFLKIRKDSDEIASVSENKLVYAVNYYEGCIEYLIKSLIKNKNGRS